MEHPQVVAIENAELAAWRDMYRAVPESFRQEFNPELIDVDGVAVTRCKAIPFVHFNAVLNLGLEAPATDGAIDAVVAAYETAGVGRITVMHHPFCRPSTLPASLEARGFERRRGWDRVCRLASPPAGAPPTVAGDVVFVNDDTKSSWGQFLDGWYRLPTSPWLMALVGRPGWVHATLVRDGHIVAARSMFVVDRQGAWFGVEAPVPGLMAPSFDEDHSLLHALAGEAGRRGAHTLTGDVEAVSDAGEGAAYARWRALGFSVAYHRSHYLRVASA